MSLRNLKYLALVSVLALGVACAEEPVEPVTPVTTPATPTADYGMYDTDVDTFLVDYVREDKLFADDTLDYTVAQGVVTVTGEVDTQEELTALQTRIRRVPGVRDVNVVGVRVAGTE